MSIPDSRPDDQDPAVAAYAFDTPMLITVRRYRNGPVIMQVLVNGVAEHNAFVADPVVREFHWDTTHPWTPMQHPEQLVQISEILEENRFGSEMLTPKRAAALTDALGQVGSESFDTEDLRELATQSSGLSYGHGNQIYEFLKRAPVATVRQRNRHGRLCTRYVLQRALDSDYENGPGRCE